MFLVHLFVCFARVCFCPNFLPLGRGLAAVCDCGTQWTFLLTFFFIVNGPGSRFVHMTRSIWLLTALCFV